MPPPAYEIANNDVVAVTFFQTYQGMTILNVQHYIAALSSPITDGNAAIEDLLSEVRDKFFDGGAAVVWDALMVDSWHLDYIQAQVIYPNRRYYNFISPDLPGQITELGVPANVAAVASFPSNIAERGRTGSKHFTGMPLSKLDANYWDPTYLVDMDSMVQKFIDDIPALGGGNWEPILWSPTTPNDTSWPVGALMRNTVRIMRRWTLGVGI